MGFVLPHPLMMPKVVSSTAALKAAPQFGSLPLLALVSSKPEDRTTYLAPPLALLKYEQTSCEKQSCVYAFPNGAPEQPAPQRPLQE